MDKKNKVILKKIELGGRILKLETGKFAQKADAAVLAQYGETVVLATVVVGKVRTDIDYFPLFVEFQEKYYAGGIIKGSRWVKREGRASDEAVLTGRLIDRSIRPLFSSQERREVQVIVTTLSVDQENNPDIVGLAATSAALYLASDRYSVKGIRWDGPIGAVRVGMQEAKEGFVLNPVNGDKESADLDLVVAGDGEKIIMLEGAAREVVEEKVVEAIEFGQSEIKKIAKMIKELGKEVWGADSGKDEKKESSETGKPAWLDGEEKAVEFARKQLKDLDKGVKDISGWKEEALNELGESFEEISREAIKKVFDEEFREKTRELLLAGKRFDGRKLEEVREITAEVGLLPRTHGSAFFSRGQTHVLSLVTLASPTLEQWIEGPEGLEKKRYMHHYYHPPYSVGETGRLGWPNRREIGHGALAERALEPVMPPSEQFPYAVRVVSEVMSSNGSTSMGAVCGSTLALMDAGVAILNPVAGVAIGLVTKTKGISDPAKKSEKDYVVLTDIAYFEDAYGDMDFKLAGTEKGMTVLQMDIKIPGVDVEILKKAFEAGRIGRKKIMETMLQVMPEPRAAVSRYAPKIEVIQINQDQIGEVIGPGGRTIKKIIAETGAAVDVEDDGKVTVSAAETESLQKAVERIQGLVREVKIGEIYDGTVVKLMPFGAFVEFLPGKEGLVHISEMAPGFVEEASQVVSEGQAVKVKVLGIDEMKKVKLTMNLDKEPGAMNERRGGFERKGRRPSSFDRDNNRRPFGAFRPSGPGRSFGRNNDRTRTRPQREYRRPGPGNRGRY